MMSPWALRAVFRAIVSGCRTIIAVLIMSAAPSPTATAASSEASAAQSERYAIRAGSQAKRLASTQMRERTVEFWDLLDARDLSNGTGPALDARRRFIQAKLEDQRLRKQALTQVIDPWLPKGPQSLEQSLRFELARRDLERIHQAIIEYQETLGRLPAESGWRRRVFCYLNEYALLSCVREQTLFAMFIAGHWEGTTWVQDRFDEGRAYALLNVIDLLHERFALDPTKNTVLGCASGKWFSVNTVGASSPTAVTAVEMPSLAEATILVDACLTTGGLSGSGPGSASAGGNSAGPSDTRTWIEETISTIDQEINSCVESRDPTVAAGPLLLPTLGILAEYYGLPLGIGGLLGVLGTTPHSDAQAIAADEEQLADAEADVERLRLEVAGAEAEAERLHKEAEAATKEAEAAKSRAASETDPAKKQAAEEEAKQKEEAAKKTQEAAAKAAKEAECRRKSGMSCADWEKAEAEQESASGDDPPPQSQLDGANYSSCATRKSQWERFKDMCDRTGGWNRPGHECNEMLRRKNGCVSSWLINPGPDGDNTCKREVIARETLIREACKRRQQVMSGAEPGDLSCAALDIGKVVVRDFADVCSNPKAMPRDHQACGPNITPPGATNRPIRGQPPKPYANATFHNGVQIYDGLGLDGLGIRGLVGQ
jgi:hypothetical protein